MISATVLADSITTSGHRLTTLQVVFPRFILAEFNTHRVFSRNSASSRAIPVSKIIAGVEENPFIPQWFPINRPGMSADEFIGPEHDDYGYAVSAWLTSRDAAVRSVKKLQKLDVHKQIANRLLEPFMWHTVIVSSTQWSNFFELRCNPAAQPEMQDTAHAMRDAMQQSTPKTVTWNGWHLPLIGFAGDEELSLTHKVFVSAARCARVSYLTHDGQRDVQADIDLAERLMSSGHWSPWEHPATPTANQIGHDAWNNFRGWGQARWYMEQGEGLPV